MSIFFKTYNNNPVAHTHTHIIYISYKLNQWI